MAGLERLDTAILQARRRACARGWHLRAGSSGDLPVPRSPTIAAGHGGENRRWRQIRSQAQASGRPSLGDGSRENVWPEAQAMSLRGRPVGSKPALSGARVSPPGGASEWRRSAALALPRQVSCGQAPDRPPEGARSSRMVTRTVLPAGRRQARRWRRGARSDLRDGVARGATGRRPRDRRMPLFAESPGREAVGGGREQWPAGGVERVSSSLGGAPAGVAAGGQARMFPPRHPMAAQADGIVSDAIFGIVAPSRAWRTRSEMRGPADEGL